MWEISSRCRPSSFTQSFLCNVHLLLSKLVDFVLNQCVCDDAAKDEKD